MGLRAAGMGERYAAPLTLLREIFCVMPLAKMQLTGVAFTRGGETLRGPRGANRSCEQNHAATTAGVFLLQATGHVWETF